MNSVLGMDVNIDERQVIFTRRIHAPRQVVWDAWTKEEHLLKWWGPHEFTNKDCSVDLRVGGKFLITMMGPDGNSYPCVFIYGEIVPIEKMVWHDKVDSMADLGSAPDSPSGSRLTLLFDDQGNITKLTMILQYDTIEHRDNDLGRGDAEGWAQSFERLDALLAK
jgi:uncharacterized protein YndB with AHSA1/START domain